MSGRDAEERADAARVRARLEAYYGRYYGGTLGIPGWRELVAVRVDDVAYERERLTRDRKSTRLNSSHLVISYAVFCLKKKRIALAELDSREPAVAVLPRHGTVSMVGASGRPLRYLPPR